MTLTISRFTVVITGLVFLAFGLACLAAPAAVMLAATGASVIHPVALIDLRATYGGMSLGVAVILFLLSTNPALIRVGLIAVLALMLGMAGGRAAGMLVEPSSNTVMTLYLVLEIATASLSVVLLYRGSMTGGFKHEAA